MRISMLRYDDVRLDPEGLAKDRRGGSGGAFGGRQGRRHGQEADKPQADADESPSIGSLLGAALGQYHGASAFEYSL